MKITRIIRLRKSMREPPLGLTPGHSEALSVPSTLVSRKPAKSGLNEETRAAEHRRLRLEKQVQLVNKRQGANHSQLTFERAAATLEAIKAAAPDHEEITVAEDVFRDFTITAKQRAFLSAFSMTGMIGRASDLAEVPQQCHSRWLREPEYKAAFGVAAKICEELAHAEASRRNVEGARRPVFQVGTLQQYYRQFDGETLRLVKKYHQPEIGKPGEDEDKVAWDGDFEKLKPEERVNLIRWAEQKLYNGDTVKIEEDRRKFLLKYGSPPSSDVQ